MPKRLRSKHRGTFHGTGSLALCIGDCRDARTNACFPSRRRAISTSTSKANVLWSWCPATFNLLVRMLRKDCHCQRVFPELHRRTLSALILLSRLLIWSLPSWPSFASYSSCTGCPRRVARRALKEHNSENIEFHLGLINKAAVQVRHAYHVRSTPRLAPCALCVC